MRLYYDLKEFVNGRGIKKALATLIFNPCFHSIVLFRMSNFFYRIKLAPFAKIVWYVNRLFFHVDIDYRANIGGGFVLVHGLGVVIGRGVIAGKKLKIYQGVTLGGDQGRYIEENEKKFWMPIIGDNATIYTDAKIFGPVRIADNVKIKANEIVTSDMFNEGIIQNDKN